MDDPKTVNRARWDQAADFHARGNVYGLEDFKAGGCRLHGVEIAELPDVRGKSLLHLQCHFGLDTLSWARRGAIVTGVDFSPKSIALARAVAVECGIDATFIESDLYALPDTFPAKSQFDIVFTSYGVICWLNDLTRWGQLIAAYLKPGGIFYIVEAHPFARVFPIDSDLPGGSTQLCPMFEYFHDPAGTRWPPQTDESGSKFTVGEHSWQHTMADVVDALLRVGLSIQFLHEFPFCAWPVVAFAHEIAKDGFHRDYWKLPDQFPQLPLIFSLLATKLG